jgi:archaellin
VDTVKFKLATASGAQAVDLATSTTLLTYADPNNNVNAGFNANAGTAGECLAAGQEVCWKSFWVIGTGYTVDAGEIVEITVDLTNLGTALGNNTGFKIEVIPNQGAVVPVFRTTPLEISPVMVLD